MLLTRLCRRLCEIFDGANRLGRRGVIRKRNLPWEGCFACENEAAVFLNLLSIERRRLRNYRQVLLFTIQNLKSKK